MQRTLQRQFSQMSEYAITSNGSNSPTAFCLALDGLQAYQLLASVPSAESWPPAGDESEKRRPASSNERRSERQAKSMTSSVVRRNERERNRIKQVNLGFERLRQHVPNGDQNKKMSKVETLRAAVDYINQLQMMLTDSEPGSDALQIDTWAMLESAKTLLPAAACSSSDSDVGMTSSCHSNGSSPSSQCSYSTDSSVSLTSTSLSLDEALTDITNWFQ